MRPDWELWLDGGHNPGAGAVLAEFIAGWHDRPLYLVVGMLNTKDAGGFLGPLAPHTRALTAVTIPGEQNPLLAEADRGRGKHRSGSRRRQLLPSLPHSLASC